LDAQLASSTTVLVSIRSVVRVVMAHTTHDDHPIVGPQRGGDEARIRVSPAHFSVTVRRGSASVGGKVRRGA